MKFFIPSRFSVSLLISLTFLFFSFSSDVFQEPVVSLENYKIEDGFELSLVASEPFLKAPVTMDFDDKGRMWVVEMIGYMPNLEGIGEKEPNGRISILEDLDKDGAIDHSKIFLEGLVLPRAIAHAYGGLLYTDGPALYFVKIKNDKPGKKTLVDPIYADAGNVEHQPNGLMFGIDNWIYNANTNYRYRLLNGKWLKEPTSYRGQWGISKDNFGRLYFNNNSTQLQGDQVLPNTVIRNEFYKPKYAVNQVLTKNQKVYPLHATSVNRGYVKGVLSPDGLLTEVTASCAPLIYRGGVFPSDFDQNVFVCVPEANLIKRNILNFGPTKTSAKQAWDDKEFLASTDEGFRPVNLFTGPDGAIYIVDMHRGIIQHKAFISRYLSKQLADKHLDTLQNLGRILKVSHKDKPLNAIPDLTKKSDKELLDLLAESNGWLRDRAQQLLIQNKAKKLKNELLELAKSSSANYASIHALYVLEGLNLLAFESLNDVLKANHDPQVRAHCLRSMEGFASVTFSSKMASVSELIYALENPFLDLYLSISLNPWVSLSADTFLPKLAQIANKYPDDQVLQEAVISSLAVQEESFLEYYKPNAELVKMLNQTLKSKEKNERNSIFNPEPKKDDNRTNGLKLFRTICGACHGADGSGIADLAPPLKESEYIDGSIHRLASIILHGISGPLHVNGKLYELNNDMPALVTNSDISDTDVADIVNYLQNAFAKEGKRISSADIKKLRDQKPENGLYTEKELIERVFEK